jgi:ABC-type nickel/cobalt efflux system permease component RcnA
MKNKNGSRSLYPAWMMTTGVLTSVAAGVAVNQLLEPRAPSAQELRQMAAAFLILGFTVFWLVTIIDGLIDTTMEIRQSRRDQEAFDAHLAAHEAAHEAVLRGHNLPQGLCGDREEHEPHRHDSSSLGVFWCSADETQRLPFAAERRRRERG